MADVLRDDAEIVSDLRVAGADPLAGGPDAIQTARFFGLTGMLTLR